jgi:hypothetical protein
MTMVARVTAARVRLQIDVTDPEKATQWTAFGRNSGAHHAPDLRTTITAIAAFAEVPLAAAARGLPFGGHWLPGGPWA